jgi:hypothetical protein
MIMMTTIWERVLGGSDVASCYNYYGVSLTLDEFKGQLRPLKISKVSKTTFHNQLTTLPLSPNVIIFF